MASSDFIQSFITAVAYTREALNILTGTGPTPGQSQQVRALAEQGGVAPQLQQKIGQLMGGGHPASALMVRVRNQLGFHWDPVVIAPAVAAVTEEPLIWIEGRGTSESASVYRLAADVLLNALIPGVAAMSEQEARARIGQASADVTDAMDAISTYFAIAIAGHLQNHDPTTRKRWFHVFVQAYGKLRVVVIKARLGLRRR